MKKIVFILIITFIALLAIFYSYQNDVCFNRELETIQAKISTDLLKLTKKKLQIKKIK